MSIEETLKAEMRLASLEMIVCKIYALQLFQSGITSDAAISLFEDARQSASSHTLPKLDPVQSDLVAQEYGDAAGRLLDETRKILIELEAIARAKSGG